VVRDGGDVTIVALASMVPRAVAAAAELSRDHGIEAGVARPALPGASSRPS
jgi:transketolase C-terminal domain/subunit